MLSASCAASGFVAGSHAGSSSGAVAPHSANGTRGGSSNTTAVERANEYLQHFGVQHIYTLSLARRTDRRDKFLRQLPLLNVTHSFHDALSPPGATGARCKQNHECTYHSWRALVKEAAAFERFPCLGVEDDLELLSARHEGAQLPPVPSDARLVSLASKGCVSNKPPFRYTRPHMRDLSHGAFHYTYGAAAWLLPSAAAAQKLYEHLSPSNPRHKNIGHVDGKVYFGGFPGVYVLCPPLLTTYASFSDIKNKIIVQHTSSDPHMKLPSASSGRNHSHALAGHRTAAHEANSSNQSTDPSAKVAHRPHAAGQHVGNHATDDSAKLAHRLHASGSGTSNATSDAAPRPAAVAELKSLPAADPEWLRIARHIGVGGLRRGEPGDGGG